MGAVGFLQRLTTVKRPFWAGLQGMQWLGFGHFLRMVAILGSTIFTLALTHAPNNITLAVHEASERFDLAVCLST